jgi:hypothetical protein
LLQLAAHEFVKAAPGQQGSRGRTLAAAGPAPEAGVNALRYTTTLSRFAARVMPV